MKVLRNIGILLLIAIDSAALTTSVILGIKQPAFWVASWYLSGLTFAAAAFFHNFTPFPPRPQPPVPRQRDVHSQSWREYFKNGGQL